MEIYSSNAIVLTSSSPGGSETCLVTLHAIPDKACIESSFQAMLDHYKAYEKKSVVLHVTHGKLSKFVFQDFSFVMNLVSCLQTHSKAFRRLVKATVLQAYTLDGVAGAAISLFLSLYTPKSPLHVCDSEEEAKKFLRELDKAAE